VTSSRRDVSRGWSVVATLFLAGSLIWPVVLLGAARARRDGERMFSSAIYLLSARICHQKDARSFHFGAIPLPVCARCTGLYLAAPVGVVLAFARRGRPRLTPERRAMRFAVVMAAIPTALTLVIEWSGVAPVTNLLRVLAALPLGATVGFLVMAAMPAPPSNQVH
jgi:uncharacterized membrane protein